MKTIRHYIDESINAGKIKNLAEISRLTGVARSTVTRWYDGDRTPDDDQAIQLAQALGVDPMEMLAECGAARAKTPETRRTWEQMAARMAASAAVIAVLAVLGAPDEVYAGVIMGPEVTVFRSILFVLLQWLMLRHPAYDGVHKTFALCIQLISSRLFVGMSALLGHRPVLV